MFMLLAVVFVITVTLSVIKSITITNSIVHVDIVGIVDIADIVGGSGGGLLHQITTILTMTMLV